MKKEKTILVYILCPNDMEYSVQYFTDRNKAIEFAKTYKNGAHVSDKAEELPEIIVNNKEKKNASSGYKL